MRIPHALPIGQTEAGLLCCSHYLDAVNTISKYKTGSKSRGFLLSSQVKNEHDLEYSIALQMEQMAENIVSLQGQVKSLTDNSLKLEKMFAHFAQEQERYLEPARQQVLARSRRTFHSQPSLSTFQPQRRQNEESGSEDDRI